MTTPISAAKARESAPLTQPPPASVPGPDQVDARGLAIALLNAVRGEVRFDTGSRALYATDGSNYRQVPIGVVVPRDVEDIVTTVAICREFGAPVLNRGGGTSLAGQCCNTAVVIDSSKWVNQIVELNVEERWARVRPGIVLDALRDAAEEHHLTFGPDPATHDHCTLGGMLGNNSCGVHSVMAGKTVDNVIELDVLTYGGERFRVGETSEEALAHIIAEGGERGRLYARLRDLRDRYADQIRARYPDIPRRVSGYNLDQLLPENGFNVARALVGSESTLVTILEAKLRLVPSPPARTLVVLGYPDVFTAADHVPQVLESGPIALEGLDDGLIADMKDKGLHPRDVQLLPDGGGWLLVEFGGQTKEEADQHAQDLIARLQRADDAPSTKLFTDRDEEAKVWEIRESGLGATADVPGKPDTWPGWEDSAVAPSELGAYLRDLRALWDRYGYHADMYGHFGQGCLHCRIDFDLVTADGIAHWRAYEHDAAELVVRHGGSLSGEHGDGQARGELLPIMFGDELVEAFSEYKTIWDPDWRMNPGKVVRPYRLDENLRLGADYHPRILETNFAFPDDEFSFANAAKRCVGVGKCRREEGGTMCPSYMVTHDEQHSTRGRARLLFEMLNGELRDDGWKSEPVREALDLCFACKGCKSDCPVNVDMATYKAEFLSHYYSGLKLRPPAAYAMGLIYWWSGLAAKAPWLANFLTGAPLIGSIAKRVGGIAPQRRIPKYAPQTFRAWWAERTGAGHRRAYAATTDPAPSASARRPDRRRVLLWPDTFNNHFHPDTAKAAVAVLEDAGFEVVIPRATLCCGRPLQDWGMLGLAKSLLRQAMRELRPEIEAGTPIVGLEPSCVTSFRDEIVNFFPRRATARRIREQTYILSEFLEQYAPDYRAGTLDAKAVVHGHCHHKSVLGMGAEESVLRKLGLDIEQPEASCCGMAGAFGFEASHYDVSMAAGERALLPAVRAADRETLVISDGFSCREQIDQGSNRTALHLAEVLAMAIRRRKAAEGGGSAAQTGS
jgi:FAD/FMN-containing dehydrogenase/Fe-S oxidoreductase